MGNKWKFGFYKPKDDVDIEKAAQLCREIATLVDADNVYETELTVAYTVRLKLKELADLLTK